MRLLCNTRSATGRIDPLAYRFQYDPRQVLDFLSFCPKHAPTPIIESASLASQHNFQQLWIKDETNRMGLGSFKALGGIYAVARILQERAASCLGRGVMATELLDPELQTLASKIRFVTASAGNHGISVATGARIFGAGATIVLANNVPREFADRLRQIPCSAVWHGDNYEESVAHAIEISKETGNILLADGSWEGYTYFPSMVMAGYTVIPEECMDYFASINAWPTHIFLQAGVGGFAAAFTAHVRKYWPVQPILIVVEPNAAPCLIKSVYHGKLTTVQGPTSIMGRLDCKQASLIAFNELLNGADMFSEISDEESKLGKINAHIAGIASTESGAAGLAALLIAADSAEIRKTIGLQTNSRCLVVMSERG